MDRIGGVQGKDLPERLFPIVQKVHELVGPGYHVPDPEGRGKRSQVEQEAASSFGHHKVPRSEVTGQKSSA